MDHQRVRTDECQELVGDIGKQRLVVEKVIGQPMHRDSAGINLAFRIDVDMKLFAGRHVIDKRERADFDDPMAVLRVNPRGLSIKNNLAHGY